MSYGFILRNKQTGRYRYFHSSCNCCGRYLDEPSFVTNLQDFEAFLQRIRLPDVLQSVVAQRPDSAWVVEIVTNATFFVNKIVDHPIGCVNVNLPPYLKHNKAVIALERDSHNKLYNDNLCLFRCLALHRGANVHRLEPSVAKLYADYNEDVPMKEFVGVALDDLYRVKTTFSTNAFFVRPRCATVLSLLPMSEVRRLVVEKTVPTPPARTFMSARCATHIPRRCIPPNPVDISTLGRRGNSGGRRIEILPLSHHV